MQHVAADREVQVADIAPPAELAVEAIRPPTQAPRLAGRYRHYVLPLLYAGSAIRHWPVLSRFWNAPHGSALWNVVHARPEIWRMLRVRFISARWGTRERLSRIVDHCELIQRIGGPFDIRPNEAAALMPLDQIAPGMRLLLDCPRWLLREGLLALNLMDGADRIFALSFTLGEEQGRRVAYVGGIQGRRADDALDRNRAITRASAGARPQDLLVELFRTVCVAIGVTRILCVSDAIRNSQTSFANHDRGGDPVTFDYDALWRERGGVLRPDGFYDLPVEAPIRDDADLSSKRRAARRKKLAFVTEMQDGLRARLATPQRIRVQQIEPV